MAVVVVKRHDASVGSGIFDTECAGIPVTGR